MTKQAGTYEHPSDLGLWARADSLPELWEALGEAVAEHVCPARLVSEAQTRHIRLEAENAEMLAVDFLSELLRLVQLEKFLVRRVRVSRAGQAAATSLPANNPDQLMVARATNNPDQLMAGLEATVTGETLDPARHALGPEIKAVTYHNLFVGQEEGRWSARVLLDL